MADPNPALYAHLSPAMRAHAAATNGNVLEGSRHEPPELLPTPASARIDRYVELQTPGVAKRHSALQTRSPPAALTPGNGDASPAPGNSQTDRRRLRTAFGFNPAFSARL